MTTTPKPIVRRGKKRSLPETALVVKESLPVEHIRGRLGGRTQGQQDVYKEWNEARLMGGLFVGIPWSAWAELFEQASLDLRRGHARNPQRLRELLDMATKPFPYEQQEWQEFSLFVCRESATDLHGQPPTVGLVVLPHDEFRRRSE